MVSTELQTADFQEIWDQSHYSERAEGSNGFKVPK